MVAIDTNVLVRLLVRDDHAQAARAAALFDKNQIYLCKTVLLETAWVLRFSYALKVPVILAALKQVLGLHQVTVEDAPAVADALDLSEAGMDFADALHLCSSRTNMLFATFDKRMKQHARKIAPGRAIEMV